jgi:hypothetical protein
MCLDKFEAIRRSFMHVDFWDTGKTASRLWRPVVDSFLRVEARDELERINFLTPFFEPLSGKKTRIFKSEHLSATLLMQLMNRRNMRKKENYHRFYISFEGFIISMLRDSICSIFPDIVVELLNQDKRPWIRSWDEMFSDAKAAFTHRLIEVRAEAEEAKDNQGLPLYAVLPGQKGGFHSHKILVWSDKERNNRSVAYPWFTEHLNTVLR